MYMYVHLYKHDSAWLLNILTMTIIYTYKRPFRTMTIANYLWQHKQKHLYVGHGLLFFWKHESWLSQWKPRNQQLGAGKIPCLGKRHFLKKLKCSNNFILNDLQVKYCTLIIAKQSDYFLNKLLSSTDRQVKHCSIYAPISVKPKGGGGTGYPQESDCETCPLGSDSDCTQCLQQRNLTCLPSWRTNKESGDEPSAIL